MKKLLIILICVASQSAFSQNAEVKKTIEQFFEAFHKGDTIALNNVLSKEMVLHSISEKPSGARLTVETKAAFLKSISSIPKGVKIEEKLLSYDIKTDGSLAHVWTPYEFYIKGKLSHKGVNSFQLLREDGQWKIIYCIDTRRK